MADGASANEPLYKITIQRESSTGGEPKFKLVPENFNLGPQAAPSISLPDDVVCPTVSTQPVFSGRSYVKCAVTNCNNYFDGERNEFMGISYFPFPQDPELRSEWVKAIDLPLEKDPDQLKVCSDHFANQDFVSDFIEVEDISEARKPTENVELRPNAKPSVKLGGQTNKEMANVAKEAWEKKVKALGDGSNVQENFKGLDNPVADTSNEMRTATVTSDPAEPLVPVITSVGTIRSLSDYSEGAKSQKDLDRERADKLGKVVDVVEVDDDDDDFQPTEGPAEVVAEVEPEPENPGLINVPASVKLPPRRTITGEGASEAAAPEQTVDTTADVAPGTSGTRTRRKRRTREEMRKCEEEDEWEPTFWNKKTLVKEGFEFEPKNKSSKLTATRALSKDTSGDEDDIFDEGFEIDEPPATRFQESPVKRRPGPASKTSRPQYTPSQNSEASEAEAETAGDAPKNGGPDLEEVLSDKSLLVDWSFFKSLIPDLARLDRKKREELKAFVLDTLNARIYEGKPIVPKLEGPVKT